MRDLKSSERLLAGALNFRDVGGLPAADGRVTMARVVFRSDNLDLLEPADVETLVDALGVGLIIDLRAQVETGGARPSWAAETSLDFENLPLLDDWDDYGELDDESRRTLMARKYMGYLGHAGHNLVRALELIAARAGQEAGRNAVVVHCAVGKDRTGVVMAVLLSLLGVQRDAIVADYVATAANMGPIIARLNEQPHYKERMRVNPPEVYRADAHTMHLFLEMLDEKAGGARQWALDNGLSPSAVAVLDDRLLTESITPKE